MAAGPSLLPLGSAGGIHRGNCPFVNISLSNMHIFLIAIVRTKKYREGDEISNYLMSPTAAMPLTF